MRIADDIPGLPPDNLAMESLFEQLRRHQRRVSGRKSTRKLRDFGQYQVLFLADSEDELLEQIRQSHWRSTKRTGVAWRRPRALVDSCTAFIVTRLPLCANCLINMLLGEPNCSLAVLRLKVIISHSGQIFARFTQIRRW